MGTYLRWWLRGRPTAKVPVRDEEEGKKMILEKYPNAVFRWKAVSAQDTPANQHICCWSDETALHHGADPVADILESD